MSKNRNYAFLLYPESCNLTFDKILADLGYKTFWILHDKDRELDEITGILKPKKPHYHVMIMFDNPFSENTASKICKLCGGNGYLENLISAKSYARYLTHMDNPQKFQYDKRLVHCLNGADYDAITFTDTERKANKTKMLTEILQFIDDNDIDVYADLVRYCTYNRPEWLNILITRANDIIINFIRSRTWAKSSDSFNRFNYDTEKR